MAATTSSFLDFRCLILCLSFFLCIISVFMRDTFAFPSGAPAEACDSLSPERGHGVPSMPVQYAPFTVIAYGRHYRPGEKIPIEIIQRERGANFKGFLVQALDADTHTPIGSFVTGKGMQLLKECSAVTHADAKPKKAVNLVWEAPYDRPGQVIFRATIVQRKDLFFANILAFNADSYYSSS